MTLTPDFPGPEEFDPNRADSEAQPNALDANLEAKIFPDEDLSGLDFDIPIDIEIPDDLSELENLPPSTHHEDPDGTQWDDPEWLAKGNFSNKLNDFVPAVPTVPAAADNFDAELAEITGDAVELAVIMTPVADAKALAAACALVGVNAIAVPNPSGAVAVLKDTTKDAPAKAVQALTSLLPAFPLLLLTKANGQLDAVRYVGGQPPQEVPAGLVVAGASGVIEDLIIGQTTPDGVAGAISSIGVSRTRAMMWLSKIARTRRSR